MSTDLEPIAAEGAGAMMTFGYTKSTLSTSSTLTKVLFLVFDCPRVSSDPTSEVEGPVDQLSLLMEHVLPGLS